MIYSSNVYLLIEFLAYIYRTLSFNACVIFFTFVLLSLGSTPSDFGGDSALSF
jgi:hypothetical protein